jgi:hypothetical protein
MMSNMSETENEEIEIEIEDVAQEEEPQEVEQEAAPVEAAPQETEDSSEDEGELDDYSKGVQKRIKKLTDKYRKEERDKQEALRLSSQLMDENKKMKDRLRLLDRGYVQEYGNRLNIEMSTAKLQYKDAADRGDSDKMLEAQEKLSRLNNEMDRHRQAKARVEREAKAPQQPPLQPIPQQQQQQQAAPQPDPKAVAWAEKNEWFGTDRLLTSATYAIHATLVEDEGFDPNADEYYSEIDRRLRSEFPNKFQTVKKSGSGAPVASGNSSASRSTKQGRRSVKLTHSQVAIAKKLGVPLEEYAKFVKD